MWRWRLVFLNRPREESPAPDVTRRSAGKSRARIRCRRAPDPVASPSHAGARDVRGRPSAPDPTPQPRRREVGAGLGLHQAGRLRRDRHRAAGRRLLPAGAPRDLRLHAGDRQAPPAAGRHRRRRRAEDARHAAPAGGGRRLPAGAGQFGADRRERGPLRPPGEGEGDAAPPDRRLRRGAVARLRRLRRVRVVPGRGGDPDLQGRPAEPPRDLRLHRRDDGRGPAQHRGAGVRKKGCDRRPHRLHQARRVHRGAAAREPGRSSRRAPAAARRRGRSTSRCTRR